VTDHLSLDEHPIRERVHYPGRPGYVIPSRPDEQEGPATMAEAHTPEAVETPASGPQVGLKVTLHAPTVTLAEPEKPAPAEPTKPASRKRR
jgi:hypothetical protein